MSFFAKGDFKLQESWDSNRPKSRNSKPKSTEPEESLMMKLGMNPQQPTTDIIDDSLSQLLMKERAQEYGAKSVKGSGKYPPNASKKRESASKGEKREDEDLLTSMSKRLQKLEKTCQSHRKQLKQKNETIEKIKTENAFLKGMKEDSGPAFKEMEDLKVKNNELSKKVEEMELYLKQYGLKWVGNKPAGNLDHQKMKKDLSEKKNIYKLPSEIDINTIKRRVQELNIGLQSEGQGVQIYSEKGVHKFRKAQPLPIAFYSNGIVIKGYNFFPYKAKESLRILGDLVDGYFPFILKQKYPNGVFLEVVDMINQEYKQQISENGNINSLDSMKNKDFEPQSKQQFLNKLPKQVIKNGKVIPIREQIGKLFTNQKPREQKYNCEEIDGEIYIKTQCHMKVSHNKIDVDEVCTLKIRNHDGHILLMRVQKEEKMPVVMAELKRIVREQFKLMGNYPRREYKEEQAENMEELGFYPNVNLHVHIGK